MVLELRRCLGAFALLPLLGLHSQLGFAADLCSIKLSVSTDSEAQGGATPAVPKVMEEWFGEELVQVNQALVRNVPVGANDPRCHTTIVLKLAASRAESAAGSYRLYAEEHSAAVEAADNAGFFNGFYGQLDRLGIFFPAPDEILVGGHDSFLSVEQGEQVIPHFPLRALWAFGDVPLSFVRWALRQRFNVVGGDVPEPFRPLFELLQVWNWRGDHTLIPSVLWREDQLAPAVRNHPTSFGFGGKVPGPDAERFVTPCLDEPEVSDFLAERVVEPLSQSGFPVLLNTWFSDELKQRRGQCESSVDPRRQQLQFSQRLAAKAAAGKAAIYVAGLSYYNTYDVAEFGQGIERSDNYLQLYYNNLRSLAEPFCASPFASVVRAAGNKPASIGFVDYSNYSIYNGVVNPLPPFIAQDLACYRSLGGVMAGYMHPSIKPSVLQQIYDYVLSRALFEGADPERAAQRLLTAFIGTDTDLDLVRDLGNALAYQVEYFGSDASLSIALKANAVWRPGLLSESVARSYARTLVEGGLLEKRPIRVAAHPGGMIEVPGIRHTLNTLNYLRQRVEALKSGNHSSWPQADKFWTGLASELERIVLLHELLALEYRHRYGPEDFTKACLAYEPYAHILASLSDLSWPEYASSFRDQSAAIAAIEDYWQAYVLNDCDLESQ